MTQSISFFIANQYSYNSRLFMSISSWDYAINFTNAPYRFVFHFALVQSTIEERRRLKTKQKIKTEPLCPTRYGLES